MLHSQIVSYIDFLYPKYKYINADFSGFLPVATNFLRQLPVIGSLLCLPGISQVTCLSLLFPRITEQF